MPLPVGSSNNLWALLEEGPVTARCLLLVQDPRGPRTAHLLPSRATPRPTAGLRTSSRRSDCSNSPYPSGAWLPPSLGQTESPREALGRAAPHSSCCPKKTRGRRAPDAGASCAPSAPQRAPSGPLECVQSALSAPPCGAPRGCGPAPGVATARDSRLCPPPTAHRQSPWGAPRQRGAVAACARAWEAAPYLSLRSRGASSRAASASPPPLLRSRRASSCSRRWDRRAEPAAGACAGAPLRLASPAHPACTLRPWPAHRGRGARGHPAWSHRRHRHLRSPIFANGTPHPPICLGTEPALRCPALQSQRGLPAQSERARLSLPRLKSRPFERKESPHLLLGCLSSPRSRLGAHVNPEPKVKRKEHLHTNLSPHCQAHGLKWFFFKKCISL